MILIVEDDPVIMLSLEFLAQQNGYQVRLAKSGEEALQLARIHHPDLILMDVMLPQQSGYDVCQMLRADENFRQTKIVLLTAKGREVDIQQGMFVGADAYVTKPFSTRTLVEKIRELLEDA